MNDHTSGRKPEPWHKDDERKADTKGGAPLGTHSFTGASANTGMPLRPAENAGAERSAPRDQPSAAQEDPVPLAEPRATGGDLLGRKR